jgi:branched-chain amino acid transport system ATP-binding protein
VRRGLSLVPEGRHVFADLTVEDNLFLGAYGINRQVRDARVEEMYERFPILATRRRQDAGSLSGGEQQMLAVSRALMRAPRLLLLDEPSLGLAPIIVEQMFTAISSLRETGVSVLLVEQNVVAALETADRAYVLDSGSITRTAPAAELRSDATLSGTMLGRVSAGTSA